MSQLKKTYLVSGAGSGIGRATAVALAQQEGNSVVLLGRNKEKLQETLGLLAHKSNHLVVSADLRKPQDLKRAFAEIELSSRNLAAVIANAGVGGENKYGPEDRWSEVIETNLTGTYSLVNEALPALLKGQEEFKHVVIVSSILARLGVPGYSAYCASKAGLLGLMRSWSSEWASKKILVNAICPGWVETDMARTGLEKMADNGKRSYDAVKAEQMSMVPLRKMSQPEEVAALVNFLISGQQVSITGQALDINNGALMV